MVALKYTPSSLDLLGRVVARKYRIHRLLGEGGMGAVFEAENVEVGRRVAIKRLFPHVVELAPTSRKRFLREARVAAQIGDPRIVDVYDVIEDTDGSDYIVMELLSGEPLSDRLARERTLSLGAAVALLDELLGALEAAHARGIIHRDIKPENIFLLAPPARPPLKILDFGISKQVDATTRLTATNAVVGSPYYMSPEQALSCPDLDQRSDLFSTGAVLFTCLTGQVLFSGTSVGKILARLITEEPPLLRSIAKNAPAELERVLDRALAPRPQDRFQTAAEMREALARFRGSPWRIDDRRDDRLSPVQSARTYASDPEDATEPAQPASVPSAPIDDDESPSAVADTAIRPEAPAFALADTRYEVRALLGRGAFAEVYEVWDSELRRSVALKRIRADRQSGDAMEKLFREAQLTAQLEHPNILPVHDYGRLASGEPYFTMKRVSGLTLAELLARIAAGDRATMRRFDPLRLAIVFLHVVQAVAHAHARGVIHCDLAPANVLIGEHGEVLVTGWSFAQLVERRRGRHPELSGAARTLRVAGPLAYLSPEHANGDAIDEKSDVYALGAILYEMLTLVPPFQVSDRRELVAAIRAGALIAPRLRAPDREVVGALEEICVKAMSADPRARFATVEELREAIEDHLTGARRRRTAEERFEEGEAARKRWEELVVRGEVLTAEHEALAKKVKPFDGETKKRPLWELEEKIFDQELAAEQALAEALDRYSQAVGVDAEYRPASDRLVDLHLHLFLEAEARGERREAFRHRRELERHHRGRHDALLAGRGIVTVRAKNAAAELECFRLVERGKKILLDERVPLPGGRAEELELPMGAYLFVLRAPGKREARVHVWVGRGSSQTITPALYAEEELGRDFVQIPQGQFIYGGDRHALNSAPRQLLELEDFFIARHPVTCEEYLEFLNALAVEDPHRARQHAPRTKPDGGYLWEPNGEGEYVLPRFDADGNPCHFRAPVMGVSYFDAQAYVAWRSERDGVEYHLPSEQQWEKAARGADGRIFPWGNGFDPTFCKMALSRPGRPQPEPVGSFPADTSVYGMMDAAGAIREWCDSFYDAAGETRVLRGGAWYFNPSYCRLAFRHGYLPNIVFTNFGFRICRAVAKV